MTETKQTQQPEITEKLIIRSLDDLTDNRSIGKVIDVNVPELGFPDPMIYEGIVNGEYLFLSHAIRSKDLIEIGILAQDFQIDPERTIDLGRYTVPDPVRVSKRNSYRRIKHGSEDYTEKIKIYDSVPRELLIPY
jgi:hypothetical protein